jgi:hypothetical protein
VIVGSLSIVGGGTEQAISPPDHRATRGARDLLESPGVAELL